MTSSCSNIRFALPTIIYNMELKCVPYVDICFANKFFPIHEANWAKAYTWYKIVESHWTPFGWDMQSIRPMLTPSESLCPFRFHLIDWDSASKCFVQGHKMQHEVFRAGIRSYLTNKMTTGPYDQCLELSRNKLTQLSINERNIWFHKLKIERY